MIGKLLVVVLVLFLLVGGVSYVVHDAEDDTINSENRIDTGLSPEQTWDIIHGKDIGEILNLRETKQ